MAILPVSPREVLLLAATFSSFYSNPVSASPHTLRSTNQSDPHQSLERTYDYVVVGGGPGGLVTANRLTEDPNVHVAVIEAGSWPEDLTGNLTEVPGYNGVFDVKAANSTRSGIDWGFDTTPQTGINNQIQAYPRGKVVGSPFVILESVEGNVLTALKLGGSSNLNAMAWSDSCIGAFDKWADEVGDDTFKYDTVSKYYRKAMNFTPPANTRFTNATPSYNPALVSQGGPLDVTYPAYANSWSTWVAVAMEAIGIKNTDTFINGALNGSAWHTNTIDHTTGIRASADRAYLRPYTQRPNLALFNGTLAERIVFNDDKVATGVEVTVSGNSYTLKANNEVIISGGAFQSPQLLQVSGVGPAALLTNLRIPVVADRPGVGQNLNDQFFFGISYRVNIQTGTTLSKVPSAAISVEDFKANATGFLTTPGGEYAGFEKIPQDLRSTLSAETLKTLATFPADWPEIEYLVLPNFVGNGATSPVPTDDYNYATLLSAIMTPTSVGNISIISSNMSDKPLINPNWLTTQSDMEVSIAMFKRLRDAWTVPEFREKLTIGDEYYPGPDVKSNEEIEQFIRSNLIPLYHASATCKMGKGSDDMAVVDSHGKVFGVKNLRVVDASAFPFLVPGYAPQAAVYMLAEKIADDIKNGN